MIHPCSLPFGLGFSISLLTPLYLYSPQSRFLRQYPFQVISSYSKLPSMNQIEHVTNSTLGFEKVFVVGLPERSDKRDALALTSSLTGLMESKGRQSQTRLCHSAWIESSYVGIGGETFPILNSFMIVSGDNVSIFPKLPCRLISNSPVT
jgi:hypothetical protein